MQPLAVMAPTIAAEPSIAEFLRDPVLTVACVLLIVVSTGWVVITRLIVRRMRKAILRARAPSAGSFRSPRDIWTDPP